jgi:hypothetical protein
MSNRRSGAMLIRDVIEEISKKTYRRQPTPAEVVAAVRARAESIIAAEWCGVSYSTKLRKSALAGVSATATGEQQFYAKDFVAAHAALDLINELGNDTPTRITAPDAAHRERARASRIMSGLTREYPDLFKGVRVVANRRWDQISNSAKSHAMKLAPIVSEISSKGITTLSGIARELSSRAVPTANGGTTWTAKGVSRVLAALPLAA